MKLGLVELGLYEMCCENGYQQILDANPYVPWHKKQPDEISVMKPDLSHWHDFDLKTS